MQQAPPYIGETQLAVLEDRIQRLERRIRQQEMPTPLARHGKMHVWSGPDALPLDVQQLWNKGANIASAGTLLLGGDGNVFNVTGTTTINYIDIRNWRAGSVVILYFAGALTLTNGAGSVPSQSQALSLNGAANRSILAGDAIALFQNGTNWQEVPSVATTNTGFKTLFDYYADAGNSHATNEIDLYSSTLVASQLSANGQKIFAEYAGVTVGHATATRDLRVYFGGTLVWDSTAFTTTTAGSWQVNVTVIRVSATVVRVTVELQTDIAYTADYHTYTAVTGLTLTNTQVLKITGQAGGVGAAIGDITAKMGCVAFEPAA